MMSLFETNLGIVPDVPDVPQRIKQEVVPTWIPRTNDPSSIDLSIPAPNIPFGVLPREYVAHQDSGRPMYNRFPDTERQLHEATAQEYIRKYQLQQRLVELGFDNDDDYPREMQPGDTDPTYPPLNFDNLQAEELLNIPPIDMEAGAAEPRIQIWGGNPRFSPQHISGLSFSSRPEPIRLFNFNDPNVAAGSIPSVSDTLVPKDVAVAGGPEKKKRAPWGSKSGKKRDNILTISGGQQTTNLDDIELAEMLAEQALANRNQIVPKGTKKPAFK